MVASVFKTIAVLGIIEPLVFNLPTTLRHVIQRQAANPAKGEVGQPFRLDHLAVGFVLAIADGAHGFPLQRLPGIEVLGIPDLNPIFAVAIHVSGCLLLEPPLHRSEQEWQIIFQTCNHPQPQAVGGVQEGRARVLPIHHEIIGKPGADAGDDPPEQPLGRSQLAVSGTVGLDVEGQSQTGTHHTDGDQFVMVPDHIVLGIANGAAPVAMGLLAPTRPGSIQSQPDETTILERFAALGLTHHLDQSGAGSSRI